MAAAFKQIRPLMECRFNRLLWSIILLLGSQMLCGCLTFRIDKVNNGAEVLPPPQEFAVGKTTLTDVLVFYGAPSYLLDMKGRFALYYQRSSYRGGQFSLSIPLSEALKVSPKLDAAGNLWRHDSAVFIFTPEGVLSEMSYEKGTNQPFWNTFWK